MYPSMRGERGAYTKSLSILDILDHSFSIYSARIEKFFTIFLLLNIVNTFLFRAILNLMPPPNLPHDSVSTSNILNWLINYGASMVLTASILFIIAWLAANIGNGLIVCYISEIIEGRGAGVRRSLNRMPHFISRIIATSMITGVLTVLGFILLVFPGLITALIFSLSIPALIIEDLSIFGSMRRSKELTDGMWWKTLKLLLAASIILIVAYLLAETLGILFYRSYRQMLLREVIRLVIVSLAEPIYPISITQYYYELRRWKMERPPQAEYPPTPPMISEVKFCHYCGQVLPYDALYCPNCGIRVAKDNLIHHARN
ncbi:MAG: hypothetical protein QW502_00630 [Candidatus Bathyarchaeia archaeon]